MKESKKVYPPLIQQFIDNQLAYPNCIVATEVGGFFEIWGLNHPDHGYIGHAKKASMLLDTVLTKRNKSDIDSPDMSGFPSHSAEGYFKKLVNLGQTVVVVEQSIRGSKSENNKNVTREISKILSPGTSLDKLNESSNNYFASIYYESDDIVGISLLDVSTGDVKVTEIIYSDLNDFIHKYNPKEILITGKVELDFKDNQLIHLNSSDKEIKKLSAIGTILGNLYKIDHSITGNPTYPLEILNLSKWRLASLSLGNLINFLSSTTYNSLLLKKIAHPIPLILSEELYIPLNGYESLDIFEKNSHQDIHQSLFGILDNCKTSMGKRLLRNWLLAPLTNKELIDLRHDKIDMFIKDNIVEPNLQDIYDIQRLARKLIFGRLMPHEINHMYNSLMIIKDVLFKDNQIEIVNKVSTILSLIEQHIDLSKSNVSTDSSNFDFIIGVSRNKIKTDYDKWQLADFSMKAYKDHLISLTNYDKLKIVEKSEGFDLISPKGASAFLKKANIDFKEKSNELLIVDDNWTRLSFETFGNKQKYIIQAKKEFENFQKMLHDIHGDDIFDISNSIAEFDVLLNFAILSKERNYTRPTIIESESCQIKLFNLRHPIVELNKKLHSSFIPNDIILGEDHKTLVIYGANSAGKSTILKSCSLAIILNQIGCFIPASEHSELTIFDSILTRISSNDDIGAGMSTFVLEMTELQNALKYINKKSLFIFDEIGRGTSVNDGEALAFATLNYLDINENIGLTLFATHYHSLADNIKDLKKIIIKHVHTDINESNEIVFKRKLQDGPGDGSYGIIVAKSCNLPEPLIRLAENYSAKFYPLKQSRYNSEKFGILCEKCQINPVQETHHIIEQKQGKVKQILENGVQKSINHISNLQMLCASCHEKITRESDQKDKQ